MAELLVPFQYEYMAKAMWTSALVGGTCAFLSVFLMHASIFVIAPLIIVRLIERLNEDTHQFTHEEQERILATLARLEERLERLEQR